MGMRWWAALWLLAEALIFWRHALFLDYAIPWDLRSYHLAHASLYAEALGQGELPLWDPYSYSGRPVQANIQAQVFYPTMALTGWLGSLLGEEWLPDLLEMSVVFHVWLAGLFAYRLAIGRGLGQAAALAAGTVYMLSGFFAAHGQHLGAVIIAAWLPLVLDSILRRQHLALAVALSMSILGGMTPATVVAFALAAVLAVVRRQWMVFGAMAGSVVLCAVQLGPTIELAGLSVAKYRADWVGEGGGVPLKALLSLVWPNVHGVFDPATYKEPYDLTFMYLYCGLAGLGLAVAGLKRSSVGFAVMAVCGALFMQGEWMRYVWMPDLVRGSLYPQYAAPVFVLGLAMLAAVGMQRVPGKWKWAAVIVCAADLIAVSSGRPMNAMPLSQEPGITREHYQGNRETLAWVRALVGSRWRLDTAGGTMAWAATAPVTRIFSANGYDPMALERTMQVRLGFCKGERWGAYYEVEEPDSELLDQLSVRYLISRERLSVGWREIEVPGFFVYENADALPRFRMEKGRVEVLRYGLREVELVTEAAEPTYLVSSETHYPGWRAWVDGVERPLEYTNVAFRGMTVPAGRHHILWRFQPELLSWCWLVSLAGWAVWGLLWWRLSKSG